MMRSVLVFALFSIFSSYSLNNALTDQPDASALRAMYQSLNSPAQLTKWSLTGGDPCDESWKGVTCSHSVVTEIKLSGLGLSGSWGFQLGNMQSLVELDMSNNNLGGQIPYSLPPKVQRLNIGGNSFTGGVIYLIASLSSITYLNISHNQLQDPLGDMFGRLPALSTLDLSFNSLTGSLPESFTNLSSMNTMYLQNNQFTGTIDVIGNLPLKNLNVANNHFSGWVPDQLKNINIVKDGNSFSSGPAPPPPPGTPPASKPNGNNNSGNNPSGANGSGGKKSGIGGGGIAGIIISLLVVTAIVAFIFVKRRSRRSSPDVEKLENQPFAPLVSQEAQEMKSVQTTSAINTKMYEAPASINLRPPPMDRHKSFDEEEFAKKPIVTKKTNTVPINATSYSIADLQVATDSFSIENLIGEGSIGRVYRAQFENGKVFAVKKIDSSVLSNRPREDFMEIVSSISRLQHQNVTELVGYCSEHGQQLLVYEFHKNGSLQDFLHVSDEYSKPLTWNTRVKIALGAARALEYLHEVCSPSVVHKHFKSANILLDTELNPHLSDSGLASFLPNEDQDAGSGYSAPEVAMSGQYTLKSDVYSFGVVMLELLTGRQPFDSSRARTEQLLVRWAAPQLHDIDALAKMVDPALKGLYPVKSLSRFADVIALCVQPEPEFRPPMSEVVQALVRLLQRANMSRRTVGNEQGSSQHADNPDTP